MGTSPGTLRKLKLAIYRKVAAALVILNVLSGCTATPEPAEIVVSKSAEEQPTAVPMGNLAIWINLKTILTPEQRVACEEYFEEISGTGTAGGPGKCGRWDMQGGSAPECQRYQASDVLIRSWDTWLLLRRNGLKAGEGAIRSESASLEEEKLTCVFYTGIREIPKNEDPVTIVFGDVVLGQFELAELEELKWKLNLEVDLANF